LRPTSGRALILFPCCLFVELGREFHAFVDGVERRNRRADAAEQRDIAAVDALDQPPDERGA
jgi:hypothetical protein